jgi:hypothetical protein
MNRKEKTDYKQGEQQGEWKGNNIQEDSKENKRLRRTKGAEKVNIKKNSKVKQQIHTGRIERRNNFTFNSKTATWKKGKKVKIKENSRLIQRKTVGEQRRTACYFEGIQQGKLCCQSVLREMGGGGVGEPSDGGLKGGLSPPLTSCVWRRRRPVVLHQQQTHILYH